MELTAIQTHAHPTRVSTVVVVHLLEDQITTAIVKTDGLDQLVKKEKRFCKSCNIDKACTDTVSSSYKFTLQPSYMYTGPTCLGFEGIN